MPMKAEWRVFHDPNDLDEKAWSRLLLDNQNGNIFQTPEMYQVYLETEHYEPVFTALVDKNEEILAVMLGVLIEEPGFLARRFSRRIVVYGCPVVSDALDRAYILLHLLKEHNNYAEQKGLFTEIRCLRSWDSWLSVFESAGYEYHDHLNVIIDLTLGSEHLWNNLKSKRRQSIRRAIKSGLRFNDLTISDLDDLYRLIGQTYARIKIPKPPKSLFHTLFTAMQKNQFAKIVGLKLDNTLVAALVTLVYKDLVFAWYCTDDRQHSKLHCSELVFWKTIEWASQEGYKSFDFGGAGQADIKYGVRDFKLRFGGDMIEIGRLINVHKPMRNKLAQAGLRFWKRLH